MENYKHGPRVEKEKAGGMGGKLEGISARRPSGQDIWTLGLN